MTDLKCPRDANQLQTVTEHGIEVERCRTCRGAWYENEELALLEANVADDDSRKGMIDYAKHESQLNCPVCSKGMRAFNYRANNLELDACVESHGFWLDSGEDERVMQLMRERVAGLSRAGTAQDEWNNLKRGVKTGGFMNNIKSIFGGGSDKKAP